MEEEFRVNDNETINKKKMKRELRNPLRSYLKAPDYIDKCPRAWSPEIYEFSENEINYGDNAFDRFIPRMELRKPDDHLEFTRYLQVTPTVHRNFYQWIIDSNRRLNSRTADLYSNNDDIEIIKKRVERLGIEYPKVMQRRRTLSESQLNRRAVLKRNAFLELFKEEPMDTRIPYVAPIQRRRAEDFLYALNSMQYNVDKCKPFNMQTEAFEQITLIEEALYGPERFYVKKKDQLSYSPGQLFTAKYKKYDRYHNNNNNILIKENADSGPAIYVDTDGKNRYHPVYIVSNIVSSRLKISFPMYVFKLETGEMVQVPRDQINKRIIHLPKALYKYIRPQIIPCCLEKTNITRAQWKNFTDHVKYTGKIYVKSSTARELKISLHKICHRGIDKFFCSDLSCLGHCVKDTSNPDRILLPNRKSRKSSISSDEIPDLESDG